MDHYAPSGQPVRHQLVLTWNESDTLYDGLQARLVCTDKASCPESFEPRTWPNDTTCRCTDSTCGCRHGDHGACGHFGLWVEDMGPECRCRALGSCWYGTTLDDVGLEAISMTASLVLDVELSGYSINEPIIAKVVSTTDRPARSTLSAVRGLLADFDADGDYDYEDFIVALRCVLRGETPPERVVYAEDLPTISDVKGILRDL